jgi:maltooligosyltrehalose synthase
MNEHLNPEAMDRYLAGERGPAAERHLLECAECREAMGRMEAALQQFRASARVWSESHPLSRPPGDLASRAERSAARNRWTAPARWAAVATAALALTALPVYRNYSRRHAAAQARADALLLEQVRADLSRPAPEPLEPLIDLISQSTTQPTTGDNR